MNVNIIKIIFAHLDAIELGNPRLPCFVFLECNKRMPLLLPVSSLRISSIIYFSVWQIVKNLFEKYRYDHPCFGVAVVTQHGDNPCLNNTTIKL